MAFLAVPGPFDFALTTARFRAYGIDRTTLWHEDGLHHAVGGRELRIEAAPGGVDVEPLDAETEPVARALLGLGFLGCQAFEFTSFVHEGLTIRTNLFGSTFFTLTGFHGAHVTAGVLWLLTLLAIDYRRGLGSRDSLLVDIAALYWHFVDVIWIVIFTLVYLIK